MDELSSCLTEARDMESISTRKRYEIRRDAVSPVCPFHHQLRENTKKKVNNGYFHANRTLTVKLSPMFVILRRKPKDLKYTIGLHSVLDFEILRRIRSSE